MVGEKLKMIKLLRLFIILHLLILTQSVNSEVYQSVELVTGYAKLDYEEIHQNQTILNTRFEEQAHSFEGTYQILFLALYF